MKNLDNYYSWSLNESSFTGVQWIDSPKNISKDQKFSIENKIRARNLSAGLIEIPNYKFEQSKWETFKNRLKEIGISYKYGNDYDEAPKQVLLYNEKTIDSGDSPLFSINKEKERVLGYYPKSYDGVSLDKFWIVGAWEDRKGKVWLKEMTAKDFLLKSTKSLIDQEFLSSTKSGEEIKRDLSKVAKKDYWTLITIIACENYADQPQGMADVAQSIYNRYHVKGKPYGKTIADIILAKNQYEPVTIGNKKGANWSNIDTKDKAIDVYMKTKGVDKKDATSVIETAIKAQSEASYVDGAKAHVKTRTEFLATPPTSSSAVGSTERSSTNKNNAFFWNYAGKENYFAKKDFSPKPIPNEVKTA